MNRVRLVPQRAALVKMLAWLMSMALSLFFCVSALSSTQLAQGRSSPLRLAHHPLATVPHSLSNSGLSSNLLRPHVTYKGATLCYPA